MRWCVGSRRTRMPAAVRGGSRVKAKPPTRTPAARAAHRGLSGARAPQTSEHHGLSAKWALIGAGAVLTLALAATLATGHRGARLAAAGGAAIDGRFGDLGFRLETV